LQCPAGQPIFAGHDDGFSNAPEGHTRSKPSLHALPTEQAQARRFGKAAPRGRRRSLEDYVELIADLIESPGGPATDIARGSGCRIRPPSTPSRG